MAGVENITTPEFLNGHPWQCCDCETRHDEEEDFTYRGFHFCINCMSALISWFLDGGFNTDPDMYNWMGIDITTMTVDPIDHATDLSDVTRDPVRVWLHNAEVSNQRVRTMGDNYYQECRWRKECIKMAWAMGATEKEIAERLGISREQVTKLRR